MYIILVLEGSSDITAYCDHCHKNLFPEILRQEFLKEFEIPSVKALIDNWDEFAIASN